jgi:hypothetical protein
MYTEGTAILWSRRVTIALLMLQNQWVRWPDQEERQQIKTRIGQSSSFGQCLGYADGSLLPLDIKPSYHSHSDWFSRKARYSLNALLVCDDENRITYMSLGWGGSAHDSRVYRNSSVC